MSDQHPPPENPYGQPAPSENPYGRPTDPHGRPVGSPNPYGQPAQEPTSSGQPPESQNPYGQPAHPGAAAAGYGHPGAPTDGARPGTVTAAGWITIVLSGLSALLYGFVALMFVVARGPIIDEIEKQPEFRDLDVEADSIIGILIAVMLVLVLWSVVSLVLGIMVLRRSNVARILLVISSAVVALGSLLSIASGLSAVWLIAAVVVIVLLFTGGAGDWFSRKTQIDFRGMGGVEDPPPPAY